MLDPEEMTCPGCGAEVSAIDANGVACMAVCPNEECYVVSCFVMLADPNRVEVALGSITLASTLMHAAATMLYVEDVDTTLIYDARFLAGELGVYQSRLMSYNGKD